MGLLPIAFSRPATHLRKLIGGVEYTLNREYDVISDSESLPGPDYQRTLVRQPVDLCIELTTKCTFSCKNCFSSSSPAFKGKHSDLARLAQLVESELPGVIRVCVTGGEPTLHPDFRSLVDWPARFNSAGFVLSTNGTNRRALAFLEDYDWVIAISLHGAASAHNLYTGTRSFYLAADAITRMARTHFVHIYSVLHDSMTMADINWLVKFRSESGASFLRFIEPRSHGRFSPLTDATIRRFAEEHKSDRVGLKRTASLTRFIGHDFEQGFTH